MGTYVAGYQHDGRAWVVQFEEPDISTWGRTLVSAKRYARELLAAYLEVDDLVRAGVAVVDRVRLPGDIAVEVERLAGLRRDAEALRAKVADETRRAAVELRGAGMSTRDVGEILGISSARVAQIERESVAA
jgi:DNA-directed RNA polymerase specialized sigma24 family protein